MGKKYSIIIPVRNALKYAKECIQSVITQEFDDYELIISNNHSYDSLDTYVEKLHHPNVRLIKPEVPLCLPEHYDFALSHVTGEWIIILGADDGVQPYFFQLCELLTDEAKKRNLWIVNAPRAYFFWSGTHVLYGTSCMSYNAKKCLCRKNTKYQLFNALIGVKGFIDLPQMYTTSIVHRKVVEKAKKLQDGIFFTALAPDASGAATLCSLERHYLESKIPISWVGTSLASDAYRYASGAVSYEKILATTILPQRLTWNTLMGDAYSDSDQVLRQHSAYFYEALLHAERVQSRFLKVILRSKAFKILFFASCYDKLLKNKKSSESQHEVFKNILQRNNISFKTVVSVSRTLTKYLYAFFRMIEDVERISLHNIPQLNCSIERKSPGDDIRLCEVNNMIEKVNKDMCFVGHSASPPVYVSMPQKAGYYCRYFFARLRALLSKVRR